MEFFLHPWYMVAGGALVSSPILIHLINRMRFKRIRWAAMEFLLKSQKRNRRRLIIEQLILLLLRILLVLLAAFLVARFVGGLLADTDAGATHVLVIDDTLSMSDHAAKKGQRWSAFDEARDQAKLLVRTAGQASSPQRLQVLFLSDLNTSVAGLEMQPINDRTLETLGTALGKAKPTLLHVDPLEAITRAKTIFAGVPTGQKIFHFVSDFRDSDWKGGTNRDKLTTGIKDLTDNGIHVSFVDVAAPSRGKSAGAPQGHDNLAIVGLQAETRVAAENIPVKFTITIQNFSVQDQKTFLKVWVDGTEDYQAAGPIDKVPAGGTVEKTFNLTFVKKKDTPAVADTDPPDERERKRRLEREFVQITAQITGPEAENTGVSADNVRDLVMEVRRKVPTLVVDGSGPEGREDGGDLHVLGSALRAARAYDVEVRKPEELDKVDLDLYPCMIFLNVAEIKEPKTVQRIADYVKNGGSIAYYMGDKVKPAWYNDVLFTKHKGLFPVLLDRPFNPLDPTGTLGEEERTEKRKEWLQTNEQPKIIFRDKDNPIVKVIAESESAFRYLAIDRYYKAQDRAKWDPEPRQAKDIIVLPNTRDMKVFQPTALRLAQQAVDQTRELAAGDSTFARYVPVMELYQRGVKEATLSPYLYTLSRALEVMLNDPGDPKDPEHPNMPNLWAQPKMRALEASIKEFREDVSFGDPLVVTRKHGKGHVVAILTAAGTASKWNNWGAGSPVSWSFEPFVMDLQTYLTREGDDLSRNLGDELKFDFEAARYAPEVKVHFQPQIDLDAPVEEGKLAMRPPAENLEVVTMPMKDKLLTFDFPGVRRPGIYTFEFKPLAAAGGPGQTETRSYAFNVDAIQESNLQRADRETLAGTPGTKDLRKGTVVVRAPGDSFDALKERPPDASESPWLYLLFLVVLVVEQALAVHLSFHLRGSEAAPATAAPSAPAAAA